jgi:hypothetical protein
MSNSSSLKNFGEHLLLVGTTISVVSAGWTVCVAATPNDTVDGIVEGAGLIAARIFLVVCLTRNPHAAAYSRTAAWSSCSDLSIEHSD